MSTRKAEATVLKLSKEDFSAPEFADPRVWQVWLWCRWRCEVSVPKGGFDLDYHQPSLGSCLSIDSAVSTLLAAGRILVTRQDGRCMVTIPPPKPTLKPPRAARKPDDLFDAVAQVTGSDPNVNGTHVAAVCKALRTAAPPFTAGEVLDFGRRFATLCPWAVDPLTKAVRLPSVGEVSKYVARVRHLAQVAPKRDKLGASGMSNAGLI
jgi:hypothetical protein